jgi:hypothetical protein
MAAQAKASEAISIIQEQIIILTQMHLAVTMSIPKTAKLVNTDKEQSYRTSGKWEPCFGELDYFQPGTNLTITDMN